MRCAGASRKVHHASLHRLVAAPISFFDTTPVGRVLNRFSKDTDDMDYQLCAACRPFLLTVSFCGHCTLRVLSIYHLCYQLKSAPARKQVDSLVLLTPAPVRSPQSVSELGNCLFQLAATLIFISIIQPWFLAGAVPLMVIYYVIQKVCCLAAPCPSCCCCGMAYAALKCRDVGFKLQLG